MKKSHFKVQWVYLKNTSAIYRNLQFDFYHHKTRDNDIIQPAKKLRVLLKNHSKYYHGIDGGEKYEFLENIRSSTSFEIVQVTSDT